MDEFISEGWMQKRLIFPPINDRGEQVVDWITSENKELIKTASAGKTTYHKRIREYIENVKPRKDMACCVISALGSYETWGQNINGDRFPRVMFLEGQHKTYEKNGFPYKHHLNKPHKGHPIYGDRVTLAEFNGEMDRVELIVWYDLRKDTSLLDDIEHGNVGVSMGMKTPYDTCTIKGCNNKAKNPDEYCIHSHRENSRLHGYRMGMILPDGQQIGRWNRYANFFDISRVLIPAWQPGRILEKVASGKRIWNIAPEFLESSSYIAKQAETLKRASIDKEADIYKTIPTLDQQRSQAAIDFMNQANEVQKYEPNLPNHKIDSMAEQFPLKKIISTMLTMGIVPKPKEFQRIVLVKTGQKDLADEFEKKGCIFTDYPSAESRQGTFDIGIEYCSEKIAQILAPHMAERSCIRPILMERMEKIASGSQELFLDQPLPKKKDRNVGREAMRTMAGIGGLYALMRGALSGGKPIEIGGKILMPTAAELGKDIPGSKLEKSFEKFFSTNPFMKLLLLGALGGGAMKAMGALTAKKQVGNYDQPLDTPPLVKYNTNYIDEIMTRNQTPFTKLGAWDPSKITSLFKGVEARTAGKTLKRALIGVPLAYLTAGTMEERRKRDPYAAMRPEGSIASFVREHPGIVAGAFTFHPHAIDIAKAMVKKASLGDEIKDWAIFGALERGSRGVNITSGVADALLINAIGKAYKAIKNGIAKKQQSQNIGRNYGHVRGIM